MQKVCRIAVVLALLTLAVMLTAAPVFAAGEPSVDFNGAWSGDKLVLTGTVSNPASAFLTAAVALDYDASKLTTTQADVKFSSPFISMKTTVDDTNGHIRMDFAYMSSTKLTAKTTPTTAVTITFSLKNGVIKTALTKDSVTISDDAAYLNALGSVYKSGGAVTIYTTPDEQSTDITVCKLSDDTAKASVALPSGIDPVTPVAVTGVTISPATATLKLGENTQLTAVITPSTATNTDVTWTSSDPTIATVSADGLVNGVKDGVATITVKTADGDKTGTCKVTVSSDIPPSKTITALAPATAKTTIGNAPSLPSKVKATYSDGSTAKVAVQWDAVPATSYAQTGKFTVNGTVEGASEKAVCTVTVSNTPDTGENIVKATLGIILACLSLLLSAGVIMYFLAVRRKKRLALASSGSLRPRDHLHATHLQLTQLEENKY